MALSDGAGGAAAPRRTVLVVDDSATDRKLAARMIERAGFRAAGVDNASDALDLIRKEAPSLVLLDLNMPKVGGFEMLRKMRNEDVLKTTKVVIMTGDKDQQRVVESIELGAVDFLVKPITPRMMPRLGKLINDDFNPLAAEAGVSVQPPGGAYPGPDDAGEAGGEATPVDNRHVLCVDDSQVVRRMVSRQLSNLGYVPAVAESGEGAMQQLWERSKAGGDPPQFGAILLDINMSGMRGQDMLEKLQGDPDYREIPVFMLSSQKDNETVSECLQLGAMDFLGKPVQKDALCRCLDKAFESGRKLRDWVSWRFSVGVEDSDGGPLSLTGTPTTAGGPARGASMHLDVSDGVVLGARSRSAPTSGGSSARRDGDAAAAPAGRAAPAAAKDHPPVGVPATKGPDLSMKPLVEALEAGASGRQEHASTTKLAQLPPLPMLPPQEAVGTPRPTSGPEAAAPSVEAYLLLGLPPQSLERPLSSTRSSPRASAGSSASADAPAQAAPSGAKGRSREAEVEDRSGSDRAATTPVVVAVSPEWLQQTGYRREEVVGRPYTTFLGPKTEGHGAAALEASVLHSLSASETLLHYPKSGAFFWARVGSWPLLGGVGEKDAHGSTVFSNESRRRVEQALGMQLPAPAVSLLTVRVGQGLEHGPSAEGEAEGEGGFAPALRALAARGQSVLDVLRAASESAALQAVSAQRRDFRVRHLLLASNRSRSRGGAYFSGAATDAELTSQGSDASSVTSARTEGEDARSAGAQPASSSSYGAGGVLDRLVQGFRGTESGSGTADQGSARAAPRRRGARKGTGQGRRRPAAPRARRGLGVDGGNTSGSAMEASSSSPIEGAERGIQDAQRENAPEGGAPGPAPQAAAPSVEAPQPRRAPNVGPGSDGGAGGAVHAVDGHRGDMDPPAADGPGVERHSSRHGVSRLIFDADSDGGPGTELSSPQVMQVDNAASPPAAGGGPSGGPARHMPDLPLCPADVDLGGVSQSRGAGGGSMESGAHGPPPVEGDKGMDARAVRRSAFPPPPPPPPYHDATPAGAGTAPQHHRGADSASSGLRVRDSDGMPLQPGDSAGLTLPQGATGAKEHPELPRLPAAMGAPPPQPREGGSGAAAGGGVAVGGERAGVCGAAAREEAGEAGAVASGSASDASASSGERAGRAVEAGLSRANLIAPAPVGSPARGGGAGEAGAAAAAAEGGRADGTLEADTIDLATWSTVVRLSHGALWGFPNVRDLVWREQEQVRAEMESQVRPMREELQRRVATLQELLRAKEKEVANAAKQTEKQEEHAKSLQKLSSQSKRQVAALTDQLREARRRAAKERAYGQELLREATRRGYLPSVLLRKPEPKTPPGEDKEALRVRSILATAGEGVISPLDKVMQRLTVEVCGFPSYFSIVIAAHIEPDNAGISSTERFVEFWEDNIRGRDRVERFWNVIRKPDATAILPPDLAPVISGMMFHPQLFYLRTDKEKCKDYGSMVKSCIFFTVNRRRNLRISLSEMRGSNLVEAFLAVDKHNLDRIQPFSVRHFEELRSTFTRLDSERRQSLSAQDLMRYPDVAMSPLLASRVLQATPKHLCTSESGRMSFAEFVWFTLSVKDRMSDSSLDFWLHCFDVDDDGYLSGADISAVYSARVAFLVAEAAQSGQEVEFELTVEDAVCQVTDLVVPSDPNKISILDIRRAGAGEILFELLVTRREGRAARSYLT